MMKTNKRISIGQDNNVNAFKRSKQQEEEEYKKIYGDGVSWFRGPLISKGSSGSVFIAYLNKNNPRYRYSLYPHIMAVKSAEVSVSVSIQNEKQVLDNTRGCPNIIKCFGEEVTKAENGQMVYNLLLEYGCGGTLADLIKKQNGKVLEEYDVRRYARSIVRGLSHIHGKGYVHCDLKPHNVVLVESLGQSGGFVAKIGDLGLAKRANNMIKKKKNKLGRYWRGTPMYFPPEAVINGIQGPPADVWAVGCIVFEMLTGKPFRYSNQDSGVEEILSRIVDGDNNSISAPGRSFLKGCLCRMVMHRLTVNMLLDHPFLKELHDDDVNEVEKSQHDVLDINSITSSSLSFYDDSDEDDGDRLWWLSSCSYGSSFVLPPCSVGDVRVRFPEVKQYPVA